MIFNEIKRFSKQNKSRQLQKKLNLQRNVLEFAKIYGKNLTGKNRRKDI
jgi:hypothetical protein